MISKIYLKICAIVLVLPFVALATTIPPLIISIQGDRPAADASLSTKAMKYLPFDVPAGVRSVSIHRQITWASQPAGIVDQGIWDPHGFRGWQGSANSEKDVVISGYANTSEPHYLPGPIPAGRWLIAQSFLKSPPGGFHYQYTITLGFDGPKPPKRMPAVPMYDPGIVQSGPRWYAGNLHSHSIYSDGALTLSEVAKMNRAAGYDFLAATDHNTYRQDYEIPAAAAAAPGLLILYGEEITTAYGHSNVIGIHPGSLFDFRFDAGDGQYPKLIAQAHQQNAIIEINHPYAPCLTCYWRIPQSEYAGVDGIEVWNGQWSLDDRLAVFAWDRLLKQGHRYRAYGGSDYHRPGDFLGPATFVYAENLSRDAIMDSLRRGHVVLSESPHGPFLDISIPNHPALPGDLITVPQNAALTIQVHVTKAAGQNLEIIWKDGSAEIPISSNDQTISRTVKIDSPNFYVRAELVRDSQMTALTNPIFIDFSAVKNR